MTRDVLTVLANTATLAGQTVTVANFKSDGDLEMAVIKALNAVTNAPVKLSTLGGHSEQVVNTVGNALTVAQGGSPTHQNSNYKSTADREKAIIAGVKALAGITAAQKSAFENF